MHARVTTVHMDPERVDQAVSELEERDLPLFSQLDGFRGFTLVVDRSSGRAIGTSYWDSEEHMRSSEQAVADSRRRTADTGGASAEPQVETFEVAVDTFVR
jgi:heme-degrading monooxygenase HmoA